MTNGYKSTASLEQSSTMKKSTQPVSCNLWNLGDASKERVCHDDIGNNKFDGGNVNRGDDTYIDVSNRVAKDERISKCNEEL